MQGYFSLVLHAHLPFVRHPEHDRFLEENWLFEAITETYLPLLQTLERWQRENLRVRLTMSMSPTLCSMLLDPLLQQRYLRHLNELIELAEKEVYRTHWDKPFQELADRYHRHFIAIRETYVGLHQNLVAAFARYQDDGLIDIITSAATHALLPLLAGHPPSVRAQILVARDYHRSCFGRDPLGIWLPECAYIDGVESVLQEANIRWFITDTHGVLHAHPRPRYGVFAPVYTPNGIAVFGRDLESAKQVWSKHEGYPGDPRYRDFYRDIGFDLDFDYVKPHLPAPEKRGFTGLKYYRITGDTEEKLPYDRTAALQAAADHAQHFLDARLRQVRHLARIMDRPPLLVSPYDAELFGHWWYEGPEFLDFFIRKAHYDQSDISLLTPLDYLKQFPSNQVVRPSASSWGEEGYWRVWLNEANQWIYPHLRVAEERMTQLARWFADPHAPHENLMAHSDAPPELLDDELDRPTQKVKREPREPVHLERGPLQERALKQAGRELLLAQSSDWPFILRTGTSPDYARRRVTNHLVRFLNLHKQILSGNIDEMWLSQLESRDNLFPDINWRYWE